MLHAVLLLATVSIAAGARSSELPGVDGASSTASSLATAAPTGQPTVPTASPTQGNETSTPPSTTSTTPVTTTSVEDEGSNSTTVATVLTSSEPSTSPSTASTVQNASTTTIRTTTPKAPKCGNAVDTDVCYYENTTTPCDICEGVICPSGKKCMKRQGSCAADCVCTRITDVEDENGICRDPCYSKPCQNNGKCVVDADRLSKFRCECSNEFEGDLCQDLHNFCLDPQPSFCPRGQYTCEMLGYRNYTCECAEGFFYNVSGRECVQVGQRVNVTLVFRETYYSEIYNIPTHKESISARRLITAAFRKVYQTNLISLIFDNFTEGSLVAHLQLMLKLHDSGEFRNNERIFKQFLLDCDTSNTACFGTLGKAFLPYQGWVAKDERCGNIVCPQYTSCEPIDGKPGETKCVCVEGFNTIGSTIDNQNRLIQLCEDIDECLLNPCPTVEECHNTPGNYTCTRDPSIATCPSGSKIVVTGPYSYKCECSWIYAGSDCRFPLTLILLILACFFLLTTIVSIVFMFLQKKRNRSGTYQLYAVPDGMSSVKTVESSWT